MYIVAALRAGDIILVRGTSLLDRAIQWASVSPYSHAALVGDGHLIEALGHVTRSPLGRYALRGDVFRVMAATDVQRRAAVAAAEQRVGQFYGWQMVAADAARDILHIPWWYRVKPRRLDCSGLVWWAWWSAGVDLTHAVAPSPGDLADSPLLIGRRPWDRIGVAARPGRRCAAGDETPRLVPRGKHSLRRTVSQ